MGLWCVRVSCWSLKVMCSGCGVLVMYVFFIGCPEVWSWFMLVLRVWDMWWRIVCCSWFMGFGLVGF